MHRKRKKIIWKRSGNVLETVRMRPGSPRAQRSWKRSGNGRRKREKNDPETLKKTAPRKREQKWEKHILFN